MNKKPYFAQQTAEIICLRHRYLQDFTNADIVMKNGFLLGAHHGMNIEDVDYVCDKIKEFFNEKRK